MSRLKLQIERLRVESFATQAPAARGDLPAPASGHPDCTQVYLCTLQSCGLPACPG